MLITFSGLDGSGKSTLIQSIKQHLETQGLRVTVLTMYYDISVYSFIRKMRDQFIRQLGISVSSTPPDPRALSLNTSTQTSLLAKLIYYLFRSRFVRGLCLFLDLLVFLYYHLREKILTSRILITDRYFYDSLVDIIDMKTEGWLFAHLFLWITPTPDVPVFVDVPAEKAFGRKQEYPIGYMRWRRGAYQKIFSWVNRPLILPNEDLEKAISMLESEVRQRMVL